MAQTQIRSGFVMDSAPCHLHCSECMQTDPKSNDSALDMAVSVLKMAAQMAALEVVRMHWVEAVRMH